MCNLALVFTKSRLGGIILLVSQGCFNFLIRFVGVRRAALRLRSNDRFIGLAFEDTGDKEAGSREFRIAIAGTLSLLAKDLLGLIYYCTPLNSIPVLTNKRSQSSGISSSEKQRRPCFVKINLNFTFLPLLRNLISHVFKNYVVSLYTYSALLKTCRIGIVY